MKRTHLAIRIPCLDEIKEILNAELENLASDGIWDKGNELVAYFPIQTFVEKDLYNVLSKYNLENSYHITELEDKNWNEEWEKNYQPVIIDKDVIIRAHFHESTDDYKHEIVITPRMSFGTGHHATTKLVIEMMLTQNFENKSVLDMGSGTGVLSFLAKQQGAQAVLGIDNDPNAVQNAIDNLKYNLHEGVNFLEGSFDAIPDQKFDIILSNITRNTNKLLLPHLTNRLLTGGIMVLAGFLNFDLEEMVEYCKELGMQMVKNANEGEWESIIVKKITK
jgi:ribosomal protein L11 methyltransferase